MKQDKNKSYEAFKAALSESASPVVEPVEAAFTEQPTCDPAPQPESKADPEVEIKGNGHKNVADVEATIPEDEKAKDLARQQEDTRREMMEAEKNKAIPGNGYLFNRERRHKLESAIINAMQLHNYALGKIQVKIVDPDWDSRKDPILDVYIDYMLEGSIAVDGEARKQFVSLAKFQNEERAQGTHGSLFANGPNG
jgi:hypothetical protein